MRLNGLIRKSNYYEKQKTELDSQCNLASNFNCTNSNFWVFNELFF